MRALGCLTILGLWGLTILGRWGLDNIGALGDDNIGVLGDTGVFLDDVRLEDTPTLNRRIITVDDHQLVTGCLQAYLSEHSCPTNGAMFTQLDIFHTDPIRPQQTDPFQQRLQLVG